VTVPFDARLATPACVLTRRLDDEVVLLNLDNECYYGLDEVSTRMWEVLCSSPSIAAGVDTLLAEYDVDADTLRADVEVFLNKLVENGLVELVTA
jgi:hypothetical protein